MKIKGIKIRIGNLMYINTMDQRGVSNIYKYIKKENAYIYEKLYTVNEVDIYNIKIAESVPNVSIQLKNYVPETIFYNENLLLEYKIMNVSKVKAEDVSVQIRIDYENAYPVTFRKHFKGY